MPNGVGLVTLTHYPKWFDYSVVALLIGVSALVTYAATKDVAPPPSAASRKRIWLGALAVFALMFFVHDHPYVVMDPFHEGEHLTPAFLYREGARPYSDVFVLHGLAYDGGLDALVLGDPPSPLRTRRLETILDSATLALLVPIAAELCAGAGAVAAAVVAGLCAVGAGQVPVFPYYRFAPILLAVFGLLHFARTGRGLFLAYVASTLGLLWSLDTGMYALAATVICTAILRPPLKRAAISAAIAIALPVIILIVIRADLVRFVTDSFVIIPRSIDAIWSRPARKTIDWESARYYLPPIFFGWLLASSIRRRDTSGIIVAIFSILAFRSAAGRCSWSHTRYGLPLFGVAVVAFVLQPLRWRWRWIAAIPIIVLIEVFPNAIDAAKFVGGWKARQTPQEIVDVAALARFVNANAPPGATILDLANERALYYLLRRRPPVRCFDVPFLSAPPLMREARAQLERNPPACVIVEGMKEIDQFDGIPNRERVPWLFAWVDQNYPRRTRIGRFVVATK
ncbi:MAG TPA: hypothetical protein VF975_05265 [Thermoanaerobaculia bacterium]